MGILLVRGSLGGATDFRRCARHGGAAALALVLALLPRPGHAQALGSQREGTSSGTFLRIGVGARAEGMGETFVAVANDPSAIYWNPAGLASLQKTEAFASHVDWPADVRYDHLALSIPSQKLGGSIGFQFGALTTSIDETTDLQPYGTGRQFTYSDVLIGVAYARRWTDKLLVGAGVKYVREDLGSQVGGPLTNAVLFDVGSLFYLGLGSIRIGTALSNFGPEMRPSGSYISPYTGEVRQYDGFDPPMVLNFGLAFEPVENSSQRLTTSFEMSQPADNQQQLRAGVEWALHRTFMLRTGMNFNADAMKFSAGLGVVSNFAQLRGTFDYAYTDGGDFGSINRFSLGVRF